MRREELYLRDIVEAVAAIDRFIADNDYDSFARNELLCSAVLQKLTTIGEAAARLSDDFQHRHPKVEWADIIGFRNIAVHEYFAVQWSIVWVAATKDAPELRNKVSDILSAEFPRTNTSQ